MYLCVAQYITYVLYRFVTRTSKGRVYVVLVTQFTLWTLLYMYIKTGDRQVAEFITQDTVFSVVVLLLNCLDINIQILTLLLAYWMYGE